MKKHVGEIVERIRQGALGSDSAVVRGEQLVPERELSQAIGASRRALREALSHLEAEGFLIRKQGHGTFLRTAYSGLRPERAITDLTSPSEVLETRELLEPSLARLAAARATVLEIRAIRTYAENAAKATDGTALERWDTAFHCEIFRSAHNSLLQSLYEFVVNARRQQDWAAARRGAFSEAERDRASFRHFKIVAAIEARDPKGAEEQMRLHLIEVEREFRA